MTERRTRYPGAQPFADDPLSRRMFFGRDEASKSLTDQILANQIVVVYAKSGLGKTSLLNAGVSPRLREEDYLPLSVRVNDVSRGPLASVLDGIRGEAERQHVEYTAGDPESLWSFFKTAEFWRGDMLMTPVLILDQFEELFTLHAPTARDAFLAELGALVRGVSPRAASAGDAITGGTPPIRVVLSLREDHLGLLEEAADHLPQILDHRFRLTPLTMEAAAAAMKGPADVHDTALQTRPFRFQPDAVTAVLMYLSRHRRRAAGQGGRSLYVEPFQLQLICQRVEQIAAARQTGAPEAIVITVADIGGEDTLRETLKGFYTASVRALPSRRIRKAAGRLCEEFLISPEGRRLSVEESEIHRQLGLAPTTLQMLVAGRLLRSDQRSDSTYYELSHDALIEPVLATRRRSALVLGWTGLLFTSLGAAFIALVVIFGVVGVATAEATAAAEIGSTLAGMALLIPLVIVLLMLSQRNLRALRRYRYRAPAELDGAQRHGKARSSVAYGVAGLALGSVVMVLSAVAGFIALMVARGRIPRFLEGDPYFVAVQHAVERHGIGLDTAAFVVSAPFVLLFGLRIIRWSVRRLLQAPTGDAALEPSPMSDAPRRPAAAETLLGIAAIVAFAAAAVLAAQAVLPYGCARDAALPPWVYAWWNFAAADCGQMKARGFDPGDAAIGLLYLAALVAEGVSLLSRRAARMHARVQQRLAAC